MVNVVGKRFIVEKTGAQHGLSLPGGKGAASQGGDVGIELADADALLLRLELVLEHDERPVSAAFRAGDLGTDGDEDRLESGDIYWKTSPKDFPQAGILCPSAIGFCPCALCNLSGLEVLNPYPWEICPGCIFLFMPSLGRVQIQHCVIVGSFKYDWICRSKG